jgi:hypothetical protein
VGAGLLADLGGGGEGVMGAGVGGAPGRVRAFAEAVERARLTHPIADLPGDGEGLPVVLGDLPGLAERGVEGAQAVQCGGLTGPVAELPVEGQGLLEVVDGLVVPARGP